MGADARTLQQWLPGLEPAGEGGVVVPLRRPVRSRAPRPPAIDKLAAKLAPRARRTFDALRAELLRLPRLREEVRYDELSHAFCPAYLADADELLRLELEPVLAATLTLEAGEPELKRLLDSPRLPEKLKAQALRSARRSGRRVFLAFLVRGAEDAGHLLAVVRERLGEP